MALFWAKRRQEDCLHRIRVRGQETLKLISLGKPEWREPAGRVCVVELSNEVAEPGG